MMLVPVANSTSANWGVLVFYNDNLSLYLWVRATGLGAAGYMLSMKWL